MKTKALQIQLLEYVDRFEKENPHLEEYRWKDFLSFLRSIEKEENKSFPSRTISGDRMPEGLSLKGGNSEMLSRQISLIYRYTKAYTKKALKESLLQTVEEFSFLVVLMTYDYLSKTDLILKNVMSKTSGTEVIKRLLKKGLITQFADEEDKRSRLVSITSKGLEEMKKIFPKMQLASEVVRGNLTPSEERTLLFLLQKLESCHHDLFLNHKEDSLEKLLEDNL